MKTKKRTESQVVKVDAANDWGSGGSAREGVRVSYTEDEVLALVALEESKSRRRQQQQQQQQQGRQQRGRQRNGGRGGDGQRVSYTEEEALALVALEESKCKAAEGSRRPPPRSERSVHRFVPKMTMPLIQSIQSALRHSVLGL